jgi:hypothetical protein
MKTAIACTLATVLLATLLGCSNDASAPGNRRSIPGANTKTTGSDAGSDAAPSTAATTTDQTAPGGTAPAN